MENRRPKKNVDSKPPIATPKSSSEVTFDSFFERCVKKGKLKFWQRMEVAAFFKDMNLRDKEDLEVYEETLKRY